MQEYPAYLKEGFTPYDPIELLRLTEEKVCRGDARKYTIPGRPRAGLCQGWVGQGIRGEDRG